MDELLRHHDLEIHVTPGQTYPGWMRLVFDAIPVVGFASPRAARRLLGWLLCHLARHQGVTFVADGHRPVGPEVCE